MKPQDCDFASEAEAKAALPYREYRAWRAWATGNPYRQSWKSRGVRPEPGVVDIADEELG